MLEKHVSGLFSGESDCDCCRFWDEKSGVVENPGKKSGVQMGAILLLPFVDAGTKDRYNVV
jgi:hypothetical protein